MRELVVSSPSLFLELLQSLPLALGVHIISLFEFFVSYYYTDFDLHSELNQRKPIEVQEVVDYVDYYEEEDE